MTLSRPLAALAAALMLAGPAAADGRGERLALPAISLIDQHGRVQNLRGPMTRGRVVVITFTFTTCESICPMGSAVMAELEDAAPLPDLRLLSITIDPAQDTPARMARAAEEFGAGEDWLWLTGAPADIDRLLEAVGATAGDITLHDPIFLVGDPDAGRFHRTLTLPDAAELARLARSFRS